MNTQSQSEGREKPPDLYRQPPPLAITRLLKPGYRAKSISRALLSWLRANSCPPSWLPKALRHPAEGYLAALLVETLAVFGSLLLIRWCPEFAFRCLLPVLAVILVALSWGAWTGLLATAWGALLLNWLILPSPRSWDNGGGNDAVSLLLFLLVGTIISLVAGQSQGARRRAEEMTRALREEQARTERERLRLRTLLDVLPAPVGMVDARGRFLERTPACKTLWGERAPVPAEIADYRSAKAWRPDTGQLLSVNDWGLARALTNGEIVTNQALEIETAEGQRKFVLDSATPIRDETGAILGAVGLLQDITELKRLEQALRQSEREAAARANQLQAVFEAMTECVLVFDSETRILQRNAADRQLFCFDTEPETLAERRALIRLRDEHGQPVPEDRALTVRALKGELINDPHAPDMIVYTSLKGDRLFNVTTAPMRDAEGHICGGVMVMRDVTERRQLEQHTRQTLNALLAMAEALVQGPKEAEQEGAISKQIPGSGTEREPVVAERLAELTRSVLGCRYVGIAAVEPETEALTPITIVGLPPEQARQWWSSWDGSAHLGQHLPPACVAALRAGEPIALEGAQSPLPIWQQLAPGHKALIAPMRVGETLVGMLRVDGGAAQEDLICPNKRMLISAVARLGALVLERERLLRERAEARASALALREANAQMDTFLGMAGHELKTPLTSIKLSLELAERRIKQATQCQPHAAPQLGSLWECVKVAGSQAERLNRLVNDLLDVSRVRAGRLELHPEPVDLAAIVRAAVEEQRQADPTRVLLFQFPGDLTISLTADADRISQVVTNYLTNALKYSAEDRRVEIGISMEDRQARVWVRDEGPGVPAEDHERIWERFHRVKGIEVQSGTGIGLGLGLYICRTIVERHHGQVGIESAPGQGSTFWFTLPLEGAAILGPSSARAWP